MRNYFTVLLISGIAGSAASVISDGSSLGKYVKYISALICTLIVISPLSSVLKSITAPFSQNDSLEVFTSSDESALSPETAAIQITEKQLCQEIEKNFGIIPIGVSIVIDRDGNITATVSLSEEDSRYADEINLFLESYT